jgi:predicted esterase
MAGETISTLFGHILPELAGNRQGIAFDIDRADLLGFSNGGTIALQVGIRRPRSVCELVIASGFSVAGGDQWFEQTD